MSYPPQNQGYPPPNQGYPQAQYPGSTYPPQGQSYQPSPQQYPQQYPQQQVYYQPGQGQPQGYVQPQQPAVFVQPQPIRFEQTPVRCQCPHCHAVVDSKVEREIGTTTCIHCLFFSCVCCCCLPLFMDCSKDASHYCPNCKKHLATYKQPAVQSGGGGGGGGFRRPSREGPGPGEDPGFGGGGDD